MFDPVPGVVRKGRKQGKKRKSRTKSEWTQNGAKNERTQEEGRGKERCPGEIVGAGKTRVGRRQKVPRMDLGGGGKKRKKGREGGRLKLD